MNCLVIFPQDFKVFLKIDNFVYLLMIIQGFYQAEISGRKKSIPWVYQLLIPKYIGNILWLIDSWIIGWILYFLHPPEKRYIGGIITSIHYLEYGFSSGNQVNMRSLDRALV